jgi:hypothetical protein
MEAVAKLDKTSWIVRIAYMFSQEAPDKVDRCTLWQRFCLLLLPWIVINLVVWFVFGLIMGVLAQAIWRFIILIFAGKKLVWTRGLKSEPSQCPIVLSKVLARISVFSYDHENIWWLNWCEGWLPDRIRSPIVVVASWAFSAFLLYTFVTYIPEMLSFIAMKFTSAGTYVVTLGGWGLVALVTIIAFALAIVAGRKGYKAFAATPSGAVVVSHLKEWKQQHCTVIELV